jgi:tRNA G18 (ribose-2'-O)-methylase SpoU
MTPWPATLAAVAAAGFELVALDPGADATIDTVPAGGPVALLVGAEGSGLTDSARVAVSRRVRIPMAPGVDSLNVATAVAVALHRLSPGRGA